MKRTIGTVLVLVLSSAYIPCAPANEDASTRPPLWDRDTLTDGWFGLDESLSRRGLSFTLGTTHVYQHNFRGGLERGYGRYSGSYDLGIEADLETMLGLTGGLFNLAAEGSYSDGIDGRAVGSVFGVNADAGGDRGMDVTELWYEQGLMDGKLILRIGKIDLTGGFTCADSDVAFDCNAFATDQTCDFLNAAFGNSPTIPFPDSGLGLAVHVQPAERFYAAFGVADAEADARETGFSTTFDGDHHLFYIFETGVVPELASARGPMPGAYRVGLWNDRQPKEYFDGSRVKRDDLGVYFSGDQVVWLENDSGDGQGLGVFTRCGWADDKVNEIRASWSCGAQYRGLLPGRDADVAGLGVAQGRFSSGAGFAASYERVVETYYNVEVTPWLHVSPSLQWIQNPGGDSSVHDAVVAGLRVQMGF